MTTTITISLKHNLINVLPTHTQTSTHTHVHTYVSKPQTSWQVKVNTKILSEVS